MKYEILIFAVSTCILFACNSPKKNNLQEETNNPTDTSSVVKNDTVSLSEKTVHHFEVVTVDTVIGDYRIVYQHQNDNQIVATYLITDGKGKDTVYYANQEILLNIYKENTSVLSNRKIKRENFFSYIPQNEITKYCLTYFQPENVSSDNIVFSISFCIPDTDVCYWFELTVNTNGQIQIKELEDDEGDM
ncbi:MAG: DUF4738 domain-containing protein [Prevotellaceae bacterium]|jgi:hypothetical protein|nr:DUF4738 domain-containing protein [Prevotellaceae bacterium]